MDAQHISGGQGTNSGVTHSLFGMVLSLAWHFTIFGSLTDLHTSKTCPSLLSFSSAGC